ncbi:MAG: hypothetical protein ACYCZK_08690 [Microbacteriaceae bacterium]
MIEWFAVAQVAVAILAGVLCVVLGFAGRKPEDLTLGAVLVVEGLLLGQLVVSLLAPLFNNDPTGSLLEFYLYLVSALLIPPLAGFWALVDRTRWSTVVLGVACLAIAVMVYRMYQIWAVQTI